MPTRLFPAALAVPALLALAALPARADLVREATSLALQGDLRAVPAMLARDDLTPDEAAYRDRFRARFLRGEAGTLPASATPLQRDLILAYRAYWNEALMNGWDADTGESRILGAVRAVLTRHGMPPDPDGDVLAAMKTAVEAEGGHLIAGLTRPHFELMIWTDQETRHYEVELTDGPQAVDVAFIGGFLSYGWSHWATFGRAYTGGWAEADRLVCLRDDYDLDSEKFRVSYLRHEARHFADYPLYPELRQPDLEYRGKLTELIYADSTLMARVRHFATAGSLNPAAPHAWANRCVVRDVAAELFGEDVPDPDDARWAHADPDGIRAAARRLLDRHDERLQEAGASTVTRIIGPE